MSKSIRKHLLKAVRATVIRWELRNVTSKEVTGRANTLGITSTVSTIFVEVE